ncbi:hypothetical protein K439DRAFT_1405655 [Ramaria rubella]|nr:hypothetical protein K439DRAFT_1405655 [Ramaria rubella]
MPLHILSTIVSEAIPKSYYVPAVLTVLLLAVVRAYSQGRRTNRDRDLHARTVILTGAFTPLGLTLLEFLAKKGAHVIALVPTPSLTSHHDEILSLLRSATSNETIYAEPCPLDSPSAIKKFCERFVNTENEKDRRVDALIMAHEYSHIGTWNAGIGKADDLRLMESLKRDEGAMATFLLTTLLLPALLVAPMERDIRIINFVNPFYAAAAPAFNPKLSSTIYNPPSQKSGSEKLKSEPSAAQRSSFWSFEGQRALRTAVFTRHLQRILDALPEPGSSPASSSTNTSPGIGPNTKSEKKSQKSNILAITVSPGISRTDTVAPYLLAPVSSSATRHWVGATLYLLLLPLLYLLVKSPTSALQSVIHVLCVPKPHTRRRVPVAEDVAQLPSQSRAPSQSLVRNETSGEEEVLVPGALYTDCSVVRLNLRVLKSFSEDREYQTYNDDSEQLNLGLGNEPLGRAVWEALETGVKIWEGREKELDDKGKARTY